MAERLVEDIFTALDEQTVVVPGTDAAALIVPSLASSLRAVLDQRKAPGRPDRGTAGGPPSFPGPDSMPGIGVRTGARILIDVGDGTSFPPPPTSPPTPASPPSTRSSGSSIRGEHPSRRGNKQLKRAFFLVRVRLAVPTRPPAPTTTRRRPEGKHHTQALLCLARRRIDVLFAMLRDGTFYEPHPHPSA